jgi:putative flippase GtrA
VPGQRRIHRLQTSILWQIPSFGLIGAVSTVVHLLLYLAFRIWWPILLANLVSLIISALLNTEANRHLTFARSEGSTWNAHIQGLVVFMLSYILTSGALLGLDTVMAHPPKALQFAVLLVSSLIGAGGRFILFRFRIFRKTAAKSLLLLLRCDALLEVNGDCISNLLVHGLEQLFAHHQELRSVAHRHESRLKALSIHEAFDLDRLCGPEEGDRLGPDD